MTPNLIQRNAVCGVLLLPILLLLFAAAIAAADDETDTHLRILVTFNNESAGKSAVRLIPGRNYRYRSRYPVAPVVRRNARTLAREYGFKTVDDWPIESLNIYCVVYESTRPEPMAQLLERLSRDPRVESVQAMHEFEGVTSSAATYNDSYANFQYGLKSMHVLEAHKFTQGDGVSVAVIDTSIDINHEDFSGGEIRLRNFVPADRGSNSTAHGTAVVSLIAANPNNGMGIVGVAPGAELIALGACWTDKSSEKARCDSFTLAKALDFLIQSPPDLINLSIAGPYDALLGRLIEKALLKGTIIVAALPNSSVPTNIYPASYPGVLAVGAAAVTPDDNTMHPTITDRLFAPGEQIMVALPDNNYDFRSGSSLAAANASGVIALILERAPGLDGERIADILHKSQMENTNGGTMIDACRALIEIDIADACP